MWLQLGGSIAAVALMVAVAWALRLGGGRIAGETEAIETAERILSGFEGRRAVLGSDGKAALVLGTDDSLAVLKMHGAQIAARRLRSPFASEATAEGLRIVTGEARFGAVTIRGVSTIPAMPG